MVTEKEKEEYFIENVVRDQIKYYKTNAKKQKRYWIIFTVLTLSLSVMTSAFATLNNAMLTIVLSTLLGISSNFLIVFKNKIKWVEYRLMEQILSRELHNYNLKMGLYSSENRLEIFVTNINSLLEQENNNWKLYSLENTNND